LIKNHYVKAYKITVTLPSNYKLSSNAFVFITWSCRYI